MDEQSALRAGTRSLSSGSRRAPAFDLSYQHRARVGMVCFLCSEATFFATLLIAYGMFYGYDTSGPKPGEVLSLPMAVLGTVFLVASSFTAHFAAAALHRGSTAAFRLWLILTIALGVSFLINTALEWHSLIVEHRLTISRNLFGTTYYTLVGFHAGHVTVGVLLFALLLLLSRIEFSRHEFVDVFEIVTWYWHFVDTVWIAVFATVYVWPFL